LAFKLTLPPFGIIVLLFEITADGTALKLITVADDVEEQLLASLTVTVYEPEVVAV
jgi:hypothetical protein